MVSSRAITCFAATLLLGSMTGCSDQLPTYPVAGKVLFTTGGPVHVGTVELKSRDHGVQARGQIQSDGSFTLTTYQDGDGAVAGVHDCVVVQFVMTEDIAGHRPSNIGVVNRRYASYSTSGLTLDISPDQTNEVIVEVEGVLAKQPENHGH
ncbi:MAG: hypothetical protein R3C53_09400 [Pirellulaceae bacterium]